MREKCLIPHQSSAAPSRTTASLKNSVLAAWAKFIAPTTNVWTVMLP